MINFKWSDGGCLGKLQFKSCRSSLQVFGGMSSLLFHPWATLSWPTWAQPGTAGSLDRREIKSSHGSFERLGFVVFLWPWVKCEMLIDSMMVWNEIGTGWCADCCACPMNVCHHEITDWWLLEKKNTWGNPRNMRNHKGQQQVAGSIDSQEVDVIYDDTTLRTYRGRAWKQQQSRERERAIQIHSSVVTLIVGSHASICKHALLQV